MGEREEARHTADPSTAAPRSARRASDWRPTRPLSRVMLPVSTTSRGELHPPAKASCGFGGGVGGGGGGRAAHKGGYCSQGGLLLTRGPLLIRGPPGCCSRAAAHKPALLFVSADTLPFSCRSCESRVASPAVALDTCGGGRAPGARGVGACRASHARAVAACGGR